MTSDDKPSRPAIPAATERVYRGFLRAVHHSSQGDTGPTFLNGLGSVHDDDCPADEDTGLAAQLEAAAVRYGRTVKVRFVTGEDRRSANAADPFGTGWAKMDGRLEGGGTLTEGTAPGIWVVKEVLRVDGSDLLTVLKGHLDRFCHLEITYRAEPGDEAYRTSK